MDESSQELEAFRSQLVDVARQRQEVHAFREAEIMSIRRSRLDAEQREDVAAKNCARRVAELADELAREAIEKELSSVDDEEAELAQINSLRMEVARQETSVRQLGEELEKKKAAAKAVGDEYESVLKAVERVRATIEDEQAADDREDAEIAAEQARLLSHLTAATRGATARLEGDWERKRKLVSAEVEAEWRPRMQAVTGRKGALKEQLTAVAGEARTGARKAASSMAEGAAAAFEAHAAPLCRQLDAESARLGSRAAAVESARSRVRSALVAEREARAREGGDPGRTARLRQLGRVLQAAGAEAESIEASDPVTGGAGAAFTAEAREQLAAVREQTLEHWKTLEGLGEEEMLRLGVAVASIASAHESADGHQGPALKMFRDEVAAEARRIMAIPSLEDQ